MWYEAEMEMAKPKEMYLRGSTWWARKDIPKELTAILGKPQEDSRHLRPSNRSCAVSCDPSLPKDKRGRRMPFQRKSVF